MIVNRTLVHTGPVWNAKGVVLEKLDRTEEALFSFDETLKIDPKNIAAWYNKGHALAQLKYNKSALNAFDKALEIDSKRIDVWCEKGKLLQRLDRKKEALDVFDEALKIDPKNRVALQGRARLIYGSSYNKKQPSLKR